MKLSVNSLSCGYKDRTIIDKISFCVASHEVLCILGPNGVGKTTLFKTILGFIKHKDGNITADGEDIKNYSSKNLAKIFGYVPQNHVPPFPYTVFDVVLMGRTAHLGELSSPTDKDKEIAVNALNSLNIFDLKDRIYTEISGGERQMVLIARALTQKPEFLIMDEPTSNLDFGNQMRVLRQIKMLSEKGLGIIMTSHFPDHAYLCASKVVLLCNENYLIGKPDDIITEKNLKAAYGIDVKIISTHLPDKSTVKTCIPLLS